MYKDRYHREWRGPYPFELTEILARVPQPIYGVYQVLYNTPNADVVAYVGIATGDTIRGRLTKHARGRGNWALGRLTELDRFRFVFYECVEEDARQIESHIILRDQPPFNVRKEYKHYIPSIALH